MNFVESQFYTAYKGITIMMPFLLSRHPNFYYRDTLIFTIMTSQDFTIAIPATLLLQYIDIRCDASIRSFPQASKSKESWYQQALFWFAHHCITGHNAISTGV